MRTRCEVFIGANKHSLPDPEDLRADTFYIAIDPAYGERFPERFHTRMRHTFGVPDRELKEYPFTELSKKGMVFLGQSATDTLLPDASVDAIQMIDVLNMPVSWYPHAHGNIVVADLWGVHLFREMARLLRPDGRILLGAKNTPELFPVDRVEHLARMQGLETRLLMDSGSHDAQQWCDATNTPFTGDWGWSMGRAYLVEIRKRGEPSPPHPTG